MKQRLPNSIRKYIRREKARIRREILDFKEQEKQISELYKRFLKNQRKSAQVASTKRGNEEKQLVTQSPEGARSGANQH